MVWADATTCTIIIIFKAYQRKRVWTALGGARKHLMMLKTWLGPDTHAIFFIFRVLLMLSPGSWDQLGMLESAPWLEQDVSK